MTYLLNYTSQASEDSSNRFAGVHPTSTEFTVGTSPDTNYTGSEYVAYVFATTHLMKLSVVLSITQEIGELLQQKMLLLIVDLNHNLLLRVLRPVQMPLLGWLVYNGLARGWGSGIYNQSMHPNETNAEVD